MTSLFNKKTKFHLILLSTLCCLYSSMLSAQYIESINTRWDDSFTEWVVYASDDIDGYIEMKWPIREDWTQWEYELNNLYGSIKMKWPDNPNYWEFRNDGNLITARTVWNYDFSSWRITSGDLNFNLKSKWRQPLNEWYIVEDNYGNFELFSKWENDPRDWIVKDNFDPDVPLDLKMAIIFLVVFHSSPKI